MTTSPMPKRKTTARPSPPAWDGRTTGAARARRRAFTLVEVALSLMLVTLLAGMVVASFTGWQSGRRLHEGAERFEATLRMARAEAANRGRRLRLAFDEETGACRVLWEADPLGEPGSFTDFSACTWRSYLPDELVRVVRCQLTGPSAYRTLTAQQGMDDAYKEDTLEAITFYPDGSSDFAVIELADATDATDEVDPTAPRALIELDGLNGTMTTTLLTAEELEEVDTQSPEDMEALRSGE